MKKLLEHKWALAIALAIILSFTMLMSFHFFKEEEKLKHEAKDPVVLPEDDELEFQNNSSISDEELFNIVSNKKNELRNLFYTASLYHVKEIDSTVSDEENEKYILFDESFLAELSDLVIEPIYQNIFNQMSLFQQANGHTFYLADRDIFESIYLDSAIAEVGILSSDLRLILANDETINASVIIRNCEEDVCEYQNSVPFELTNVEGKWKVSAFLE